MSFSVIVFISISLFVMGMIFLFKAMSGFRRIDREDEPSAKNKEKNSSRAQIDELTKRLDEETQARKADEQLIQDLQGHIKRLELDPRSSAAEKEKPKPARALSEAEVSDIKKALEEQKDLSQQIKKRIEEDKAKFHLTR